MDSLKTGAAYDFSAFLPEQREEEAPQPEKQPRRAAAKPRVKSGIKPGTVVKYAFVSIFVMLALGSTMVGNIKINQLSDEISSTNKQLTTAQSEQVSLSAKLEARLSMQKVADYATGVLGLSKIQPYQIEYVHLVDQDKVVVSPCANDPLDFIKNLAASVVEYFD